MKYQVEMKFRVLKYWVIKYRVIDICTQKKKTFSAIHAGHIQNF